MPVDRRTEEEIRREITTEREQLAAALSDLREGITSKRRPAAMIGGLLATGLAAVVAARLVRRFTGT